MWKIVRVSKLTFQHIMRSTKNQWFRFYNREMLRLQQFYNIFTTNHGWLVIIGSSLNLVLKLLF